MKSKLIVLALALSVASVALGQIDQKKTSEQQIEEALSALPEALRDDVEVRGFDDAGNPAVLREGTSHIVCHADDPNVRAWTVTCFPKSLEAFVTRSEALTKAGEDTPARIKTLKAEIESGAAQLIDARDRMLQPLHGRCRRAEVGPAGGDDERGPDAMAGHVAD